MTNLQSFNGLKITTLVKMVTKINIMNPTLLQVLFLGILSFTKCHNKTVTKLIEP